jgi:hypothetical protein
MPNLSADRASLMRAARNARRPHVEEHDRVLNSLRALLGDELLRDSPHFGGPSAVSATLRSGLRVWLWGAVPAVGVAWGIAHWLSGPAPSNATAAPVAEVAIVAPPAASNTPDAPASADPVPPHAGEPIERGAGAPRTGPARSGARAASDMLSEEVALLARATHELNGGRPDDALRTLGEHERRFPRGALTDERLATRVEALCALRKGAEAKAEVAKLVRVHPRSPYLEHARTVCGWDASTAP